MRIANVFRLILIFGKIKWFDFQRVMEKRKFFLFGWLFIKKLFPYSHYQNQSK